VETEQVTEHEAIIHDVAFDFYGRRMATCSADQQIKVRSRSPRERGWWWWMRRRVTWEQVFDLAEDGKWKLSRSWKVGTAVLLVAPRGLSERACVGQAHTGPIVRVVWAHPEFGQVLASCSPDRTCVIWEEHIDDSGTNGAVRGCHTHSGAMRALIFSELCAAAEQMGAKGWTGRRS
jgi:nucleoporin SEH1